MNKNIAVSIKDLKIDYGKNTVIKDLNIDIKKGEFLVLLGPSGCGKSTLLSSIAGLQENADGRVWISGKDVTWSEPKDRGIGMVFQSYALYPTMTVKKNLSFGLRVAGLAKNLIEERVSRTSTILKLDELLDRKPSELSGGQRQRVAIGRALVRDVDVFLFDEPLSNLDAKLRNELRIELKKLHLSLGNTMIYVTHDQIEAMTLADRIAIMRGGKIQQLASPHEIYSKPKNLFVAGFIGSPAMNFIQGDIHFAGEQWVFKNSALTLPLAEYEFSTIYPEPQHVTLGMRPEHLFLAEKEADIRGTVTLVEPMGAETVVWFDWNGANYAFRFMGDTQFRPGDDIALNIDVAKALLFGADEERL
ncbi:ABC transporter ATP-binding protein [Marinomonas sp.]|uniref:ABC transporter ATP-binding protein n=1 Tax=Marinomonas sp. TaxID=1904862 RepID=UPI003BA8A561